MKDNSFLLRLDDEFTDRGHLLHMVDFPGAYTRGESRQAALDKLPDEYLRWHAWAGLEPLPFSFGVLQITGHDAGSLAVEDADSEILFESEQSILTRPAYDHLKSLALKSAADFMALYASIPDRMLPLKKKRRTFYGDLPVTASDMYLHVLSVNHFYFSRIGIQLSENDDLYRGRQSGFEMLEQGEYLENSLHLVDGEAWTLRKVLRRFIWHDRIHAKALYRSAARNFPDCEIVNPFHFSI